MAGAQPAEIGLSDDAVAIESSAPQMVQESHPRGTDLARIFVSDATPERVASLLSENGGRMAVLSDEGEICSIIAGRYGGSFEVFLRAHSGQMLTVERQGRARVHVRRPALTLGLAVQPDVLQMLAGKRVVRERGLLARFLVAVPASNVGYRIVAPPPVADDIIEAYTKNVRALLETGGETDDFGEIKARALTFAPEAHEAFIEFEREVETMLRPEGILGCIQAWGAKLPGEVARVAGIVSIGEDTAARPSVIGPRHIENAIRIGRYAIGHALAAFQNAGSDRALSGAREILRWIQKTGKHDVTKREIHQALRGHFAVATDVDPALAVLAQHGLIRSKHGAMRRGRPSHRYAVHPTVIDGHA